MRLGTIIIIAVFAIAWEVIAGAMIGIGGGLLGTPVKSLEVAGWLLALLPVAMVLLVFMGGFEIQYGTGREDE